MRAIEVGRRSVRTVNVHTSLREAAHVMASEGLRAIVVVAKDGSVVGIINERDLVVRALARNVPTDTPVESVMTPEVFTVTTDVSARTAYQQMRTHRVRQLPLVEEGRLVGMVERADLDDEADAEVLSAKGHCPHCNNHGLRPVSTRDATNFLCMVCRTCWHLTGGTWRPVETRLCPGCPEHNFCRFPLIDYGVETSRFPPADGDRNQPC
jgi:CBS domain-containing protein